VHELATASLMSEILSDPASEAARLVYADHLLELGDPRGELVHAQCTSERLPVDDPARFAIDERATDLIAAHETEWTRELRVLGLADHVQQLAFRRGFVENLRLSPGDLAKLPGLRAITPVRHATVSPRSGGRLDATAHDLVELEGLTIYGAADLGRTVALAFESWPHRGKLRSLQLGGGVDAANAVARTPALRGIERLAIFGVGDAGIAALVTAPQLETLTALELPLAGLTLEGVATLASCERFATLTALELESAPLRADDLRVLASSPMVRRLRHLRLHGNPFGAEGARALVAQAALVELLDLEGTDLGASGAAVVFGAAHLPELHRLDVSRCKITDAGMAAAIRKLAPPALRHLVATENELGYATTHALASAPALDGLLSLDLSKNPLADDAIGALANADRLRSLRTLRLRRTSCGDRALANLGAGDLGARLRWLDVGGNSFDDDGLLALLEAGRLDTLERLDLDGARLSRRGIQALVDAPVAKRLRHLSLGGLEPGSLAPLFAAELPELRMLVADQLDDDAARLLATVRGLPRLHTLILTAKQLTDAGARSIASCALDRVLWMELDAPELTDEGKAAIRDRFAHHAYVFSGALLHAFGALGRKI